MDLILDLAISFYLTLLLLLKLLLLPELAADTSSSKVYLLIKLATGSFVSAGYAAENDDVGAGSDVFLD